MSNKVNLLVEKTDRHHQVLAGASETLDALVADHARIALGRGRVNSSRTLEKEERVGKFLRARERIQSGFTLIELMIAVAIIGLLAALAYPAYTSHLVKGRRAGAQAHLMLLAQRQTQYLLDARTYGDLVTLNVPVPQAVSDYYTFSADLVPGPPPSFTVTATPKPTSAQKSDVTLSLDSAGTKLPVGIW